MTPSDPLPGCPDAETLAARVDARLSLAEREAIDAHLASCEDCYEAFAAAARMSPPSQPASWRSHRRYAALGLIAATVVAAIWIGAAWRDPDRQARAEMGVLADLAGQQRFALGRIGPEARWAPAPQSLRSGTSPPASREARATLLRAEEIVARRRSPDTLTTLGVAQLAAGDVDASIASLEEAARTEPVPLPLRVALSAALLERWRKTAVPEDAVRALDHATIAAAQDPRNPAALFNRALASEYGATTARAVASWQEYLDVDGTSDWAREARERLDRLKREPSIPGGGSARVAPGPLYRQIDEGLGAWAHAVRRGERLSLDTAHEAASVLADEGRDRHLLALVTAAAASEHWPPPTRACLADAVHLNAEWRRAYDLARHLDAARLASEAEARFNCAGLDAFPARLAQRLTALSASGKDSDTADVDQIEARAMAHGANRLAAQAAAVRGLVALLRGQYSDGIEHHRRSYELAERAGDAELVATSATYLANVYDEMGDADRAWRYRVEAFARLDLISNRRRQYVVLASSAVDAADANMPGVALALADDLVARTADWDNPAGVTMGHLVRARAFAMMARDADAAGSLEAARTKIAVIEDSGLKQQFETELAVASGRVLLRRDAAAAAVELTRGLDALKGNQFRTALLLLLRGRAYLNAGDERAAERDWLQSLALIEDERAEVRDQQLRISRFDEVWDVVGELTRLYAATPERALAIVERGHARELLDWMAATSAPDDEQDAASSLPDDLPVFVYAALDDRLLVWRLAGGRVDASSFSVTLADLTARVDAHVRALAAGQPDPGSLGDLLLPWPVDPALSPAIAIAPDGPLHRVAFGALRRSGSPRALVEDLIPVVTPSLAILRQTQGRRPLPVSSRAVLVSASGAVAAAGLPVLPQADREIDDLVRLYAARGVRLSGTTAWPELRTAIASADIFHFAGHATADPAFPARSRLFLSPGDRSGAVTAAELAELEIRNGAVVVLSACDTAQGRIYRGEGPLSLARPFLARGAGSVVATLWRVGDDDAAQLMVEFHRRLQSAASAPQALAESQRDAIARGRSPRTWAAFSAVGISTIRR